MKLVADQRKAERPDDLAFAHADLQPLQHFGGDFFSLLHSDLVDDAALQEQRAEEGGQKACFHVSFRLLNAVIECGY